MNYYIIKIILFLLLPAGIQAQLNSSYIKERQLDSLQVALKNAANDTIRLDLYKEFASYYSTIKRDSSLYFSNLQLAISQKLNLKLYEADALNAIGYMNRIFGNYSLSLQFSLKALKLAENPDSEINIWGLSKDETPREARLKKLAFIHFTLGLLYSWTGNIEKQLFHYRECEKFASEINDKSLLSAANLTLGVTYSNLNKLDSALSFELKAFKYSTESSAKRDLGRILNAIGTIHSRKRNYALAKQNFTRASQVSLEYYNLQSLGDAYVNLANLFRDIGNVDSSLWYSKKGLSIYQSMGSPDGLVRAYTSLSSTYKSLKNLDSAFIYQELAMVAKDSMHNVEKIKQFQNIGFDEQLRLQELEKEKIQVNNKIRTYAMLAGITVFMVIASLLYRNSRNRRKANLLLQKQNAEIEDQKKNVEKTLAELKATQSQLIQSEKMASLGELTAGIAHEIQNPLNFVNNFSEVNTELIQELKSELKAGNHEDVVAIADNIADNEQKINHHGRRADAIVKGMLQHSRSSSGKKEPTDINTLSDEYLRLAYHGLRAKDNSFNAIMKTDFDETIGNINIIPQDIGRVILNLITNAFYAVIEKKKQIDEGYEPTVSVSTKKINDKIEVTVTDNGNGIPQKVLDKIFQPFFTTKPTGEGTGLGLSLSYDIVKAHRGEIKVETKEKEGTEFTIQLPG